MLKQENGQNPEENWRILIVEDDERLATLTKDYLESNCLKASVEGDGSRAIECIKTEQPDLVVLDLMTLGSTDGLRAHYSKGYGQGEFAGALIPPRRRDK